MNQKKKKDSDLLPYFLNLKQPEMKNCFNESEAKRDF